MPVRHNRLLSPGRLLVLVALALGACAAPAASPPTSTATAPPTATLLPPTAAATAESTAFIPNIPVRATSVSLAGPSDIAFDSAGNLFISSAFTLVSKVDPLGLITNYAGTLIGGLGDGQFGGDGGPALSASFNTLGGLAFDSGGNLYIADGWNHRIRLIDQRGLVSTVAGNGPASGLGTGGFSGDGGPAASALLQWPTEIAFDPAGNLYISDSENYRIRKVDAQGIMSTFVGTGQPGFAGDGGPATAAQFDAHRNLERLPGAIAFDTVGNLYLADTWNGRVRKVDRQGLITTIAGGGPSDQLGDGGLAISATLSFPSGLAFDAEGNLYVATLHLVNIHQYGRIRKIDTHGIITTVAGVDDFDFSPDGGLATAATLNTPGGIAFDRDGNMYVVDSGNNRVRKIDKAGIITTVAGGAP